MCGVPVIRRKIWFGVAGIFTSLNTSCQSTGTVTADISLLPESLTDMAIGLHSESVVTVGGRHLGKLKGRPEHALSPYSVSPDGEWIVWLTLDSLEGAHGRERVITARRYDGRARVFRGLSGVEHAIAVTAGATSLIIGGIWARALELRVYQMESDGPHRVVKIPSLVGENDRIERLASNGAGLVVVVGTGSKIFVIDTVKASVLLEERGRFPVFSVDGRSILFVGPNGDIRRRIISDQGSELLLSTVRVKALGAVTPDGSWVTMGFQDNLNWKNELGCFSLENRKLFRILNLGEGDLGSLTAWINPKWAE